MLKPLKIVSISAEVAPFSKDGGLADVAKSLPKALKRLGHEIIVITPLYGQIIDVKQHNLKLIRENVRIYLNSVDKIQVNFWQGELMENLPIYFIENKKYFSAKKTIYGSAHENARFLTFDVATLKLISFLKFEADIVHCHDWHTGLIPYYLKTDFQYSETLKKTKTVFTIHNLAFQLGYNWWEIPNKDKDYGHSRLPHLNDPKIQTINFAKRAILSADIINTVSEQYREEILTKKFGQDLHRILGNRQDKLYGIINGIDYKTYNPDNDQGLFKNYNYKNIHHKKLNKEYLQKKVSLPVDQKIPIIALTSRVTFQKGINLVLEIIEPLVKLDVQIIIMGDGDKTYIAELKKYNKKYPKKIVWLSFKENQTIETLIYAGSDIFLLPSHHEPCGINQLIAMRYGCIPVVRKVGGLYDTVTNFNPKSNQGTGFNFTSFDKYSLFAAIIRALENFQYENIWRELIVRVMKKSNSWEIPAKKYIALYRKAIKGDCGPMPYSDTVPKENPK
ncbi:glycogen synthase [Patescibacteria group bacterium]|nr:glycogen synthase [Patescibacteria group bacterium]MBU2263872.1 glycogen synthase [Patescibacteria group bacterium]